MRLKNIKGRLNRILARIAIFVVVINGTFVSALIPEAKAMVVVDNLVINEIDYDQPSTDMAEFIELKNNSAIAINLDNYELRLISGAGGGAALYATIDLPSFDLNPSGYYVICGTAGTVANCNLPVTSFTIQNGDPDAVSLYSGGDQIDTVSYVGDVLGYTETAGAQDDVASMADMGLSRMPDGQDTYNNSVDFAFKNITPGATNNDSVNQLPSAPLLDSPNNGYPTNDSSITFRWNESGDPDSSPVTPPSYQIQIDNNYDFGSREVDVAVPDQPGSLESFLNTTSLGEGTYYWRVISYDGQDYSPPSSVRSFTVDTILPVITNQTASPNPFSPDNNGNKDTTNISYSLSEYSNVTVTVTRNETGDSWYLIQNQSRNKGTNAETWNGMIGNILVTDPSGPFPGDYTVDIKAIDQAGNSSIVKTLNPDVTIDLTGPEGNLNLDSHISNVNNNGNPIISGTYTDTSGATQFKSDIFSQSDVSNIVVQFSNGSDIYQKTADFNSSTGNFTTNNPSQYENITTAGVNVLPEGIYTVKVLAFDLNGASVSKDLAGGLRIDTTKPGNVTNLQVTAKTPNSVTLAWAGSADNVSGSGIGGYKVYYGTGAGVYTGVRDVGNVTTAEISGLNSQTAYYFTVKAYDKAGNDSLNYSNEVSETTPQVLSTGKASGGLVSAPTAGGIVESAQAKAENPEDENTEEQTAQTKGKNSLFWIALIILVLGLIGYYYYNENSDKLKNLKFPKLPGIGK